MLLFKFATGLRADDAIDGQIVILLKLTNGLVVEIIFGRVYLAAIVSEIVEPGFDAGSSVERIEVSELYIPLEKGFLIVGIGPNLKSPKLRVGINLPLNPAVAVGFTVESEPVQR